MANKQMPQVGDTAPDFSLPTSDGGTVKLSDFKGKRNVILSFHPLAWTNVCSAQMLDLELHEKELQALDAQALGINVDSVPSKAAWKQALGIHNLPLLSDFHPQGQVAELYGIRQESGPAKRAVFVVDKQGVIRFAKVYPGGQVPDLQEAMEVLKGLQ